MYHISVVKILEPVRGLCDWVLKAMVIVLPHPRIDIVIRRVVFYIIGISHKSIVITLSEVWKLLWLEGCMLLVA